MPDPYDPPDPGPIDDLQRETERIVRTLGERAEARAQRSLAEQLSAERAAGERAERDAERRRADLHAGVTGTAGATGMSGVTGTSGLLRESGVIGDGFAESQRTSDDAARAEQWPAAGPATGRDRAQRAGDRAEQGFVGADRHDRLAARLQAHGIDRGLAQTRVRADRSFGAAPTRIGGRPAAGARTRPIIEPHRSRTGRAGRRGAAVD